VGRDRELARLRSVADGARRGEGGALLLVGGPGVGKTALLRAAAPRDLPVVWLAGAESELDLPFAAVGELLAALPGCGRPDEPHGPGDPAAVLQDLAKRVARAAPLAILADDVQWLDASSRTAVAYLARRAHRLGIAVLATWSLRGEEPEHWPGVPALRVDELEREDALRLATDAGLAPAVAEALVDAVGGVPLALCEAPAELSAAQRAGRQLLPEPLPVGPRLRRAYAARVAALPAATRDALLLAAAGAPASVLALDVLEPAEDAGLVRLGDGCAFTHPLARSAVYHAAAPSARRAAHRTIAGRVAEPERSWQRALAAPGPDAALAGRLVELGERARARGAPGAAAAFLERAARLTPDPGMAVQRTTAAAGAALVAGRPARALALLDPVVPAATDPGARADVQLLRGVALQQIGRPREACALLEAEAALVVAADPGRASALLTHAAVALMGPGPLDRLAALADRALTLAPDGPAAAIPAVVAAEARVALGDHRRAREMLDAHDEALVDWDPTAPGHEILVVSGLCRLWLADHDQALAQLRRLVEADRAAGAASVLAPPLGVLATYYLRVGDLHTAAALAGEAEELADTGLGGFGLTLALTAVALVAAPRGDGDTCLRAAGRLRALAGDLELTTSLAAAEQAVGHLRFCQGDAATAAEHFASALGHLRTHGTRDPAFFCTHADLVEALVRCGRPGDAEPVLAELEDGAARTEGAWARAAVERCRGLLGPDAALDGHLEAALALHETPPMPFEGARTRLALGERLRRARRRVDARAQLTAARDAFAAMGAPAWAARAAQELEATGGPARRGASTGPGAPLDAAGLTARERDVCARVAGGATNREVADALFLSPRTVEHHLRMAYSKLGVRSRSELAARWPARV